MLNNKIVFYIGTLVGYLVIIFFVGYYTRFTALEHSENNIKEYLISIKSVRSYVSNQQKDEVYRLKSIKQMDAEYFSPQLLSSTYSAKEVNKYYNDIRKKLNLSEITVRFASNNPMNPNNLANQEETKILSLFNKNRDIKSYSKVINNGNDELLYYAVPVRENSAKCMQCHSDPKIAPKQLVKLYGTSSGFHENIGDIRAIISTQYPLEEEYIRAMDVTKVIAMFLFGVLLLSWYLHYKFLRFVEAKNQKLEDLNHSLADQVQKQILETINLNDQLNYVIEGSQLGYWDWYPKTKKHLVNDIWLQMLGLTREDINETEDDWLSRVNHDDLQKVQPIIYNAIKQEIPYRVEFRMKHKDGHWVWIAGAGSVVQYDEHRNPVRICGTHTDISAKKTYEIKTHEMQEYLDTIFYENPNIIMIRDDEKMIHANKLFFEFFTEYKENDDEFNKNKCICDLFESVNDPDFIDTNKEQNWLDQIINNPNNKVLIKRGDTKHYFTLNAKKITLHDKNLQIISFTNITPIQELKEQLQNASIIDELTKLYNRRYFNEFFNREISRAKRDKQSLTFMMLDIDHFKNYNDNYGHLKGDIVLHDVAQRIKSKMQRANDFVFRLGGEEFAVILIGFTKNETLDYAIEIKNAVNNLKIEHKFTNDEHNYISVSVGLKHVDFEKEDYNTDEIYSQADKALYEAKNKGRNTVVVAK